MFGLAVLGVFLIYLLISVGVVSFAVYKAKRRGIAGWKWGVPAAIFMYLIVFWDQIPVYLMHKYYCAKDGGFTIYKTLDEWNKANPGVVATLNIELEPKSELNNGQSKFWTTQRFYTLVTRESEIVHGINREEIIFVDAFAEDVLARSINYARGASGTVLGVGGDLRGYFVLGMGNRQCGREGKTPTDRLSSFRYSFILKVRGVNND